jgi:hypothetical protein
MRPRVCPACPTWPACQSEIHPNSLSFPSLSSDEVLRQDLEIPTAAPSSSRHRRPELRRPLSPQAPAAAAPGCNVDAALSSAIATPSSATAAPSSDRRRQCAPPPPLSPQAPAHRRLDLLDPLTSRIRRASISKIPKLRPAAAPISSAAAPSPTAAALPCDF